MAAIVPAELAFAGDGTPFSSRYGDIYHSSQGGLEQARHVGVLGRAHDRLVAGVEGRVEENGATGLGFEGRKQPVEVGVLIRLHRLCAG